jgi:MIP family channel proteins
LGRVSLPRACAAEVIGTFLLVLFGTGSVAASVFTGAQVGLWQVAAVWGFGVAIAIYVTAAVSGAHLNPAVTLAFALLRPREFPARWVPAYWAAQLGGAVLAGVVVLLAFNPFIREFERENGIDRGEPGSERSAMAFGEYFPNPAMFGIGPEAESLVSPWHAFAVEAFGTAILAMVIFAVVDRRNAALPSKGMAPFFIGFTVAILISLFAPITQAGWNPARDFGPRLVALAAGWGEIAIPGPRGGFWIYILGPLAGAPLGAALYDYVIRRGLAPVGKEAADEEDEKAA